MLPLLYFTLSPGNAKLNYLFFTAPRRLPRSQMLYLVDIELFAACPLFSIAYFVLELPVNITDSIITHAI